MVNDPVYVGIDIKPVMASGFHNQRGHPDSLWDGGEYSRTFC
jgi:hypothetical protein